MKKNILFAAIAALVLLFTGCKDNSEEPASSAKADLVVYGNIYTSESSALNATAFAVKDGKYVYVGDKEGAAAYVGDNTKVIDRKDGMIMAGCTEAHGHYITDAIFQQLVYFEWTKNQTFESVLKQVKEYYDANKGKINQIVGFGWSMYSLNENDLNNSRKSLDAITTEIPIFLCDHEYHQGLANSKAFELAGIKITDPTKEQCDESIAGGVIYRTKDKVATGQLQDQAGGYVRLKAFGEVLPDASKYEQAALVAQKDLLSLGYTNYMDAWLSYFNTDGAYKAFYDFDKAGKMKMNVVGSYEIDSYRVGTMEDAYPLVDEAVEWKNKYTSKHFFPRNIKMFADGTTETYTGYCSEPYPATRSNGLRNWDPDFYKVLVPYINSRGITVHTHSYGDLACKYVMDAYEESYNQGYRYRNGLGHVANITDYDLDRIAKYGSAVAEGFCWHVAVNETPQSLVARLGSKYLEMYPMNRFFQHNVPVASSTDYPCSVNIPKGVFEIMEVMLTGENPLTPGYEDHVYGKDDLLNIKQAIQAMTINGAWTMGLENERGSIKVGKYADFIIIDQDIFNIQPKQLHNTKVLSTYFEGEEVYQVGPYNGSCWP